MDAQSSCTEDILNHASAKAYQAKDTRIVLGVVVLKFEWHKFGNIMELGNTWRLEFLH